MSEGLRAVAAAIDAGTIRPLIESPEELFLDTELPAVQFVKSHFRRYRQLPELDTVQTEVGVRFPAAPEPLAFYVDRLYERHEYNLIRDRFGSLRDAMQTMDMPAMREAVAGMHAAGRATHAAGRQLVNVREGAELMFRRLEETRGFGGVTGIETGWPQYDLITGGYQDGDLITLVGRPGTGKTYVALKQAKAAHEAGHSTLVVTTEMPTEQLMRRHASLALGINPQILKTNTLSSYMMRRMRSLYETMVNAEGLNIFSVGMNATPAKVEALIQEMMPDLIVIDGLYLLRPSSAGRNMSRTEKITGVMDEIKAITLDVNRPVVATTQFSRQAGAAGKEGTLENIGYTDAIGTHSSLVAAIKFGPTVDPKKSRYLEFLKGREGEEGRVAINFRFAPTNLDEIPYDVLAALRGGNEGGEAAPGAATAANVDWMA